MKILKRDKQFLIKIIAAVVTIAFVIWIL